LEGTPNVEISEADQKDKIASNLESKKSSSDNSGKVD
jgi:hypothetical protein